MRPLRPALPATLSYSEPGSPAPSRHFLGLGTNPVGDRASISTLPFRGHVPAGQSLSRPRCRDAKRARFVASDTRGARLDNLAPGGFNRITIMAEKEDRSGPVGEDANVSGCGRREFSALPWAVPASATLVLAAACKLTSEKYPLWQDEILTRILLGSHNFGHMIRAVADGIDSSPPLYWCVMWFWTRLFGLSEFNLRLFSSLAVSAAFFALWTLCRRVAGFWPATLAVVVCFFLNAQIFLHATQCRNYPLFLALTAIVLLQIQRIGRKAQVAVWDILLLSGSVGMLVLTHLFGFLFSGILFLAIIVSDLAGRRFRPLCYLAIPAGWLAFVPWIPAFLQQMKIGEPRFWIVKPPASVLWDPASYLFGLPFAVVASALILGAAALLADRKLGLGKAPRAVSCLADPILLAGVLLVTIVPLLSWTVSEFVKPIWFDRYQLPALLGWGMILAYLAAYIIGVFGELARRRAPAATHFRLLGGAAGTLVVVLCFMRFYQRAVDFHDYRGVVGTQAARDRPTATQSSNYFLYMTYYQSKVDVYFVLDWPSALKSPSPGYVTDYNIISALKRNYPEYKVLQASEFLSKFDRFYFWDTGRSAWVQDLVAADPRLREARVGIETTSVERVR